MKKALISLMVFLACILTVTLTNGLDVFNFEKFYIPLLLIVVTISVCIYFAKFTIEEENEFHHTDTQLNGKERVIQYHSFSAMFRYFIIPQVFLILYYPVIAKIIVSVTIFLVGYLLSNFYGMIKITPLVNTRREKEKIELEEQNKRESDKD